MSEDGVRDAADELLESLEPESSEVALVPVPDADALPDATAWARDEASGLAALGAIRNDALTLEVVAALLHAIASSPHPEGFTWRWVAAVGPDRPFLTVELAFVPATRIAADQWPIMVAADRKAPLGSHEADFELHGVKGTHRIVFETRAEGEEAVEGAGEIWGTAAVVCRRDLPEAGATDILAAISTPYVEELFIALPHLYNLLTGEYLAELVGASIRAYR